MTDYIEKTCAGCGHRCRLDFDEMKAVVAQGTDLKALRDLYASSDVVYCNVCYPSNWRRY